MQLTDFQSVMTGCFWRRLAVLASQRVISGESISVLLLDLTWKKRPPMVVWIATAPDPCKPGPHRKRSNSSTLVVSWCMYRRACQFEGVAFEYQVLKSEPDRPAAA